MITEPLQQRTGDLFERRRNEYASVWSRLWASSIDWTIAVVVGCILGFVAGIAYMWVFQTTRRDEIIGVDMSGIGAIFLFFIVAFVVACVVHVGLAFMVAARGDTPGHGVMRLSIERAGGSRLGWRRALSRELVGSPCVLIVCADLLVSFLIYLCIFVLGSFHEPFNDLLVFSGEGTSGIWSSWLLVSWIAIPVLLVVNHVWMVADVKGRGLHDRLLDTVVLQYR